MLNSNGQLEDRSQIVASIHADDLLLSVDGMFRLEVGMLYEGEDGNGSYHELRQATNTDIANTSTKLVEVYTDNGSDLGGEDYVYTYMVIHP